MPASKTALFPVTVAALVDAIRMNLADHPKVAGIEHDAVNGEVVFTLRDGRRYALADAKFLSIYEPLN